MNVQHAGPRAGLSRRRFLVGGAFSALAVTGCGGAADGEPMRTAPQTETAAPESMRRSAVAGSALPPADPVAVGDRFAVARPRHWGTAVPGVITRLPSRDLALTLDACGGGPGDGYDEALIRGLIERSVPATLFLNKRWIDANPQITRRLAANSLFELANHGTVHRPLSVTGRSAYQIPGTRSAAEVVDEVWVNHRALTALTGTPPRFFRAGTAHYDEVAVEIVAALGETVAGFSVNADGGATLPAGRVRSLVSHAAPGSILLAHMNHPESSASAGILRGVDDQLSRGARFAHLSR